MRIQILLTLLGLTIAFAVRYFEAGASTLDFPDLLEPAPAQVHSTHSPASQVTLSEPLDGRTLHNEFENAPDLYQIYLRYKDSAQPLALSFAYRAWTSCYPNYLIHSASTAAPNPHSLAAERILRERCRNFSQLTSAQTLQLTQTLEFAQAQGRNATPGEIASLLFKQAKPVEARALARQIIQSQDAYAIATLKTYFYLNWSKRESEAETRQERPDLRALGFELGACQLGLDCSATSFSALALCAQSAYCEGNLSERYQASLSSPAERIALREQILSNVEAIRKKNYTRLGL